MVIRSNGQHPGLTSPRGDWRCWTLLLLTAVCCVLAGCTMIKLREESKAFLSSTALVGRISSVSAWDKPVVVVAYSKHQTGIEIAHSTLLHEPGGYELVVPKGDYYLFAFGDTNGNLNYDAGEPAGEYDGPGPIAASGDGVIYFLDFVISEGRRIKQGSLIRAAIEKDGLKKPHSTQAGALADLDDPVFSAAYGKRGYWSPMDFYKEVGGNVYFLEPYNPAKTPILFVHGAGGSPQDWRYFFEHVDRSRYQPWFFYYPSGASVGSMSNLLYWKLFNLHAKYRFQTLYITAHSMGGLVVRSFLEDHGTQCPYVRLFVSISTPWEGEDLADVGVRHSPAVIPSWNDLRPEGRFIQTLFAKKLPEGIEYYLFFGHKGSASLIRPNNDGAITLASQLRRPAQAEARMIYGFNEDHVSILSGTEVLAQYNTLLRVAEKKVGDERLTSEGSLRIQFLHDSPDDGPRPAPVLLLRPVDPARDPIVLPLTADDSGRDFGPFRPGEYTVSLVAHAFRTEPRTIPVRIGAGRIPELTFLLTSQGVLSGYVGADVDRTANPAGAYRPPHEKLKIRLLTLIGAGEQRRLVPSPGEATEALERYLAGEDYAFKSSFSFVGLANGEYELTIEADGYHPYIARYRVVPGDYRQFKPIVLTPLK
jgi:pimeloyl-ACP methyl ester carboxylesterase